MSGKLTEIADKSLWELTVSGLTDRNLQGNDLGLLDIGDSCLVCFVLGGSLQWDQDLSLVLELGFRNIFPVLI